ncbi:MAG TPA: hypothetical protein VGK84_04940 [Candidatus Tumulicola sp.]
MTQNAIRSLTALTAMALPFGCAARAADSDIPTMRQAHMQMTIRQSQQPGDRARADAILAAARRVMAEYPTVQAAEAAGFTKFLPHIPLPIEHYTKRQYALEAYRGHFDPMHPTSLIFERSGSTLTLVGVMYTASNRADRAELNNDVPLSFGTWHRHVDFCTAPAGTPLNERLGAGSRFGMQGSIDTADACSKAGGTFLPLVFGWMVHVWPNEKTDAAIWAVDRHASMERNSM